MSQAKCLKTDPNMEAPENTFLRRLFLFVSVWIKEHPSRHDNPVYADYTGFLPVRYSNTVL